MSQQLCPHCYKDMKLDTDFMYRNDMFDPDKEGIIECPLCGEKVKWFSFDMVGHDFAEVEDEN